MGRDRCRAALVVAAAAVVLTAGCGAPSDPDPHGYRKTAPAPTDTLPAGVCPDRRGGAYGAAIDYVDFVQHDGRTYVRDGAGTTVAPDALGEKVGVVRCTFSGNTDNPWLAQRDGDAAFLAPGTELRAVAGRPATQEIAARLGARWVLYRAEGAPSPTGS